MQRHSRWREGQLGPSHSPSDGDALPIPSLLRQALTKGTCVRKETRELPDLGEESSGLGWIEGQNWTKVEAGPRCEFHPCS